jgi:hypothetical protein
MFISGGLPPKLFSKVNKATASMRRFATVLGIECSDQNGVVSDHVGLILGRFREEKPMQTREEYISTHVVNIRNDNYDVYCGRAGKGLDGPFGNPYRLGQPHPETGDPLIQGQAVELFERGMKFDTITAPYRKHFEKIWHRLPELQNKVLGCFCKPRACHCDILAGIVWDVFMSEQND